MAETAYEYEVIIIGGGPVGVGLAIDLAINGHRSIIVERHETIQRIPKGQNLTPRTGEHFRRWGVTDAIRAGDASASGTELGPIIDRANQQRLATIIDRAASAAQMVVHGGIGEGDLAKGYFITPSMFEIDDVHHDLVQEELFGPIVSLERFGDEDEALAKANATRYGLAASVYTTDLNRSMRMGRKLSFGTVCMNCHNRLLAEVETGGYRESGIGRLHGIEAMNDFLETKHIYLEAEN